jgi:peptidyl-prolyl cis-trans isomerase SurA
LSSIPQTRVSHILLLPNNSTPQATLISRLNELKQRIQANKISFASAAREVSQDGSAPAGGELGWVNPGTLVPEFETAMNQLPLNAISDPVVSRFGVHLIQVLERKKAELKPNEIRELARNQLRQTKLQETYTKWIGELRERAFVELRDAPL